MLEKLEDCPVCGAVLTQGDYDAQRHADHWDALRRRYGLLRGVRDVEERPAAGNAER